MKFLSTFAAVSAACLVAAAPSSIEKRGLSSRTRLYARAEAQGNGIEGHFEFWGRTDGTGTFIKIEVTGLVANSTLLGPGPFRYHIHTNPVGKDRNCSLALGHLDPLNVTESLICDPAFPQYCQEGDLSGKHGKFNGTSDGLIETFGYTDDYVRFFSDDDDQAFSLLGRSIVIHAANITTRLACGDIISTLDGTASHTLNPTFKPSKIVKKYPTSPPFNPSPAITPFVGTVLPSTATLQGLPWPLPNPAISLRDSLNVHVSQQPQSVFVNGVQQTLPMFVESKSSADPPFKGFMDKSWDW